MYQKFIKRYEHTPTPSQPINNCSKFPDVTSININHVNNDKYDRNLGKCGSPPIYSVEYRCTINDILVTTTNITAVNPSYSNPTRTIAHSHRSTYVVLLWNITSLNIAIAIIHVISIFPTVITDAPLPPSFLPNNPATAAPIIGNQTIVKYINARRDLNPQPIT